MSGGHGHVEGGNKKIALLVAVLAALLAISEMGGKSAQTHALSEQIDCLQPVVILPGQDDPPDDHADGGRRDRSANSRTVRSRCRPGSRARSIPGARRRSATKSEPETNEGRKELAARAKVKEEARDKALSAYHMFEYGSAALQLAIVLAGASALTTVAWLMFMSIGLGAIGIAFAALGFFAPTLIHL